LFLRDWGRWAVNKIKLYIERELLFCWFSGCIVQRTIFHSYWFPMLRATCIVVLLKTVIIFRQRITASYISCSTSFSSSSCYHENCRYGLRYSFWFIINYIILYNIYIYIVWQNNNLGRSINTKILLFQKQNTIITILCVPTIYYVKRFVPKSLSTCKIQEFIQFHHIKLASII